MLEPLETIQQRAEALATKVGAAATEVTYGGYPLELTPNIQVSNQYHFVVFERGVEFERRSTDDLDQLLYWILDHTTGIIAARHEREHREPDRDFRRQWFGMHEALLSRISPAWGRRKHREIAAILRDAPYDHTFTPRQRPVHLSGSRDPKRPGKP